MVARHELLGGKVQVFQRANSPYWQCSATVGGRQFRASTKTEGLAQARDFAEDWFLTLKGKERFGGGIPKAKGKTFKEVADVFMREFELLTQGERSARYIKRKFEILLVHLIPFFGKEGVAEISTGRIHEYRLHRMTSRTRKSGEIMRPAKSTLHQEMVALRQVLKTALRHGWLAYLPDMSVPYRGSGKIAHRAWFSHEEYKRLYQATGARAKNPPHRKWRWECEQLHDFVLFMANTGLRPDEAARLQFRDVTIVDDEDTEEQILEIEVRGKRGIGFCKSMPGAVFPFQRLQDRLRAEPEALPETTRDRRAAAGMERTRSRTTRSKGAGTSLVKPKPTDLIFGSTQRDLFNAVLDELDLKIDREGQRRTAYSLRHSYICFRLMEGADIYQIAKNCRTSVEMIENFYASHIKSTLDASAINVRKVRKKKPAAIEILADNEAA